MKTCVIWGLGDIGEALAEKARAEGFSVIAVVHKENRLDRSKQLADLVLECDLGDPRQVQAAVVAISQQVETVDWWIYSAGDIVAAPMNKMDPSQWKKVLDANLNGFAYTLMLGEAVLDADSVITVIGAVSEKMRLPGLSAYAAAKAGLEAAAEVAARDLRKPVQVLRPGAVKTSFWNRVPFRIPPGALSPSEVASKAYDFYQEKKSGKFDL